MLYVFVATERGLQKLVHLNLTRHSGADWTLLQLKETLAWISTEGY